MFLKSGNSLFGNSGIIISICILIILLYFSYNKCYTNNNISNFEEFICNTGTETECTTLPRPENVRALINGGSINLKFTLNNKKNLGTPLQFIVVLAQYDNAKKNTGNNKFYLSNEYELTSSVIANVKNYQTNLCTIANGIPACQYTFNNIDIRDTTGNLFYYKIGISAIYDNYNTEFISPYNINSMDKMFTLGDSLEAQNKQYKDFLSYQEAMNGNHNTPGSNTYSQTMSTADGQYELIKAQLGHYPDNLLIDNQTTNNSTLSDLVDKGMSNGSININVKMDSENIP